MIRLLTWAILLGAGFWLGGEYQKYAAIRQCLDAGGGVDPRGFCEGARNDG